MTPAQYRLKSRWRRTGGSTVRSVNRHQRQLARVEAQVDGGTLLDGDGRVAARPDLVLAYLDDVVNRLPQERPGNNRALPLVGDLACARGEAHLNRLRADRHHDLLPDGNGRGRVKGERAVGGVHRVPVCVPGGHRARDEV